MPTDGRHTWVRWSRFRLRTLAVAILILGIPLAWVSQRLDRVRRQRRVSDYVMNMDGYCVYDYEHGAGGQASPYPTCLLDVCGEDFFHSIREVHFPNYQDDQRYGELRISNERIALMEEVPDLRYLNLREPQITDAAIPRLARLKRLRYLNIYGSSISDAGAARLREELPQLEVSRERIIGQVISPSE